VYFLIYVSSAVELFSDEELIDLLEVSRRNNQLIDVTGLLLYKDGNFMQYLEGPKENVLKTMEKVKRDRRHRGVITLLQNEESERKFSDWSMGFKKLSGTDLSQIPGYSDFLNAPLVSEAFTQDPSNSLKLLLHFKTSMR
jgi:hypothetical protein